MRCHRFVRCFALAIATSALACRAPAPAAPDEAPGSDSTSTSSPTANSMPSPHDPPMSSEPKSSNPYSMRRVDGQLVVPAPEALAALPSDGGSEFNRLIFESSPYLLQHARNPVDWNPWGAQALARAVAEDKPIFLSIGYSTCHWCHVMEHESFEDPEVARLMNEAFVCIKVDREERPDVDQVYMATCQAMTGQGGWPLTIVATPQGKPFFAGTYFPRQTRMGRVGMLELVPKLSELWSKERERVEGSADQIVQMVQSMSHGGAPAELDPKLLQSAEQWFRSSFDTLHGGFGGAPKFPVPHNLRFLLRRHARTQSKDLLVMAEQTLTAMRLGGLFDQVGFGFHRYSTDEQWLLPHFEKMLYDQALLVEAYVDAWTLTGDEFYRRTARETLEYMTRKLRSQDGLFRSAEDADSFNEEGELEEGAFYVWTPAQLRSVLGREDAGLFAELFGVREGGNFVEESTGHRTGGNILHLERRLEASAQDRGMETEQLLARVEQMRDLLFRAREARVRPLEDDKRLTDWNGLAIAALAASGAAFDEPRWTAIARNAADRLLEHLRDPVSGRLWKRSRAGQAGVPAVLDDYAFTSHGLLTLYFATGEIRYLQSARELVEHALQEFWDKERGGFFLTARDGEALFSRPRESYDGALPSGNGVLAGVLLELARYTGDTRFEDRARELLRALAEDVSRAPFGHTRTLLALDFSIGPALEIVLVGRAGEPVFEEMQRVVRSSYRGHLVLHVKNTLDPEAVAALTRQAPFTEPLVAKDDQPTAYVCRQFACEVPLHDAVALGARVALGVQEQTGQ